MKRHLPNALLAFCLILFGMTIHMLLQWRFATGDVYPPYSSLRADPLGTMALYESLERFPHLAVSRDHQMANRLPDGDATTYLHLAARSWEWDELPAETVRVIEGFMAQGGRLVVTFTPEQNFRPEGSVDDEETKKKDEKKKKEDKKADKSASPTPDKDASLSLAKRWGLKLERRSAKKDNQTPAAPIEVRNVSGLPLPKELTWHSETVLAQPGASWQTIYARDGEAVMAERSFGPGTMVVVTDSYFVSNEAMLRDREPELLAWLVGPARTVVFDEAHLGIMDSPGIAALARKYRLHGVVAALIVLALLFIWKNSSSLAQATPPARAADGTVTGRDASAGFISLLRRNVPATGILALCLQEWNRTFARSRKYSRREKEAIQAVVDDEESRPERKRDPVAAYRRICAILHRGKPLN